MRWHSGLVVLLGLALVCGGVVRGEDRETGFPYETVRELLKMGHDIRYALGIYGGYQAIRYDAQQNVYYGASESRKDGQATGY